VEGAALDLAGQGRRNFRRGMNRRPDVLDDDRLFDRAAWMFVGRSTVGEALSNSSSEPDNRGRTAKIPGRHCRSVPEAVVGNSRDHRRKSQPKFKQDHVIVNQLSAGAANSWFAVERIEGSTIVSPVGHFRAAGRNRRDACCREA
jgi:hypothetical protein